MPKVRKVDPIAAGWDDLAAAIGNYHEEVPEEVRGHPAYHALVAMSREPAGWVVPNFRVYGLARLVQHHPHLVQTRKIGKWREYRLTDAGRSVAERFAADWRRVMEDRDA